MNKQPQINSEKIDQQDTWNRQRTKDELASFVVSKLAKLESVSLED